MTDRQEHASHIELDHNREKLINEVLKQVLKDVENLDLTAIEELIKNVPDTALMAYLPEMLFADANDNLMTVDKGENHAEI